MVQQPTHSQQVWQHWRSVHDEDEDSTTLTVELVKGMQGLLCPCNLYTLTFTVWSLSIKFTSNAIESIIIIAKSISGSRIDYAGHHAPVTTGSQPNHFPALIIGNILLISFFFVASLFFSSFLQFSSLMWQRSEKGGPAKEAIVCSCMHLLKSTNR